MRLVSVGEVCALLSAILVYLLYSLQQVQYSSDPKLKVEPFFHQQQVRATSVTYLSAQLSVPS